MDSASELGLDNLCICRHRRVGSYPHRPVPWSMAQNQDTLFSCIPYLHTSGSCLRGVFLCRSSDTSGVVGCGWRGNSGPLVRWGVGRSAPDRTILRATRRGGVPFELRFHPPVRSLVFELSHPARVPAQHEIGCTAQASLTGYRRLVPLPGFCPGGAARSRLGSYRRQLGRRPLSFAHCGSDHLDQDGWWRRDHCSSAKNAAYSLAVGWSLSLRQLVWQNICWSFFKADSRSMQVM